MKTSVWVREQVLGTHYWPGVKMGSDVDFLQQEHHHNFHIEVETQVEHNDRSIEFIQLRKLVLEILYTQYETRDGILRFEAYSCESIATRLIGGLKDFYTGTEWVVTVSEDNIQGARVYG